MHFMSTPPGWFCQVMKEDLTTSWPRKFNFQSGDKVMELAMRGGEDVRGPPGD